MLNLELLALHKVEGVLKNNKPRKQTNHKNPPFPIKNRNLKNNFCNTSSIKTQCFQTKTCGKSTDSSIEEPSTLYL